MNTTPFVLASSLLCLLSFGQSGAQDRAARIADARTTLEKWVETRRLISQEKRDWVIGRELLEGRIELVQREIDSLRTKIGEAKESITAADEELAGLVDQRQALKATSDVLVGIVTGLEGRTSGLLRRLPDPIRERVRVLSQRIPKDPEETTLGLGERFQNVIGVLNEVNKFNREITVVSEVRTLEDGKTAEVTSLYVGIGQSYYVTATGDAAGVGTSGPDGWTWSSNGAAAAQIAEAVSILQGEEVASFVKLPIRVD